MSKIKIPTIPNNAIIKLEVSGSFYGRIVSLFLNLGQSQSQADFKKALESLGSNTPPPDLYTEQIHILSMLMHDIEKKAQEQGLTKEQEVEVPET